jgi:hypothetical protein
MGFFLAASLKHSTLPQCVETTDTFTTPVVSPLFVFEGSELSQAVSIGLSPADTPPFVIEGSELCQALSIDTSPAIASASASTAAVVSAAAGAPVSRRPSALLSLTTPFLARCSRFHTSLYPRGEATLANTLASTTEEYTPLLKSRWLYAKDAIRKLNSPRPFIANPKRSAAHTSHVGTANMPSANLPTIAKIANTKPRPGSND